MRRYRLLAAISCACVVAVSACSSSATQSAAPSSLAGNATQSAAPSSLAGQTLTVGVYGGGWDTDFKTAVIDPFEKQTGATIQMVSGDDTDFFAKFRAAGGQNPPLDVAVQYIDEIDKGVPENLFVPLDTSKVSDWSQVDPATYTAVTLNGKVYGAPFSFGQLGIFYRTDKITTPPTSWLDLWNPAFKGHVALPPLTYEGGLEFFAALVHTLGGQLSNPADVQKAFDKLRELAPNVGATPSSSGQIQTLIQNGDAWISVLWDGRIFALQNAGTQNVGFVYPTEGPVGSGSWFSIAAGTQHLDLAYQFLTAVEDAANQKTFGEQRMYAMANDTVQYSSAFQAKVKYGVQQFQKLLWVDYNVATPNLDKWQSQWNQIFGQ